MTLKVFFRHSNENVTYILYLLFFMHLQGWSGTKSTITAAIYWPIVPALDYRWWWLWRKLVEWTSDRGNKYLEKTCPSAAVHRRSHMNWPRLEPDHRRGKPTTNCLSYATVTIYHMLNTYHSCKYTGQYSALQCNLYSEINSELWVHHFESSPSTR
jgi:hypothetical protein